MKHFSRILLIIGVAALALTVLPLLGLCGFSHPYYDDFTFSAVPHDVWRQTHSLSALFEAAVQNSQTIRRIWQGTYTGTLLTNLQPGLFGEAYYGFGPLFLILSFTASFFSLFYTLGKKMSLSSSGAAALSCWMLVILLQWMPSVAEGFYWFNGGIGNTFIYSVIAIGAVLCIRLCDSRNTFLRGMIRVALLVCAVILGGGSYTGGILSILSLLAASLILLTRVHPRRFSFLTVLLLLSLCFAYSVTAPGNTVRAGMIGARSGAILSIAKAVYYGTSLIGTYFRLPLMAVSLTFLPLMVSGARQSVFQFRHPVLVTGFLWLLFCSQLVPTLYAGVFLGGDRTVNTYFFSFHVFWLLWLYYMVGFLVRRYEWMDVPEELPKKYVSLLLCASLALFAVGALGTRRDGETLYGIQNMNGTQACVSLLNGEAKRYDAEMKRREELLNDEGAESVTLKRLSGTPSCFMPDLLYSDGDDPTSALCLYYHKRSVGREEAAQ